MGYKGVWASGQILWWARWTSIERGEPATGWNCSPRWGETGGIWMWHIVLAHLSGLGDPHRSGIENILVASGANAKQRIIFGFKG